MASLATVADVEAVTGRDLQIDAYRVERLIELVSAAVRAEAMQTLDLVEDDAIQLEGTGTAELWLPQRPVIAVTSIEVDGDAVAPDSYRVHQGGLVRSYSGYWGTTRSVIDVTYDHGYTAGSNELRYISLMVAEAVKGSLDGDDGRSESIGGYAIGPRLPGVGDNPNGVALNKTQKREIRRRFRPAINSIRLGTDTCHSTAY